MTSAADPSVEWRVLGPVDVLIGGRSVSMGGSARRLLALLLATPGRVVSISSIVDGLWGDDPPAGAEGAIQSYVSRLRRALTEAGLDGARLIVTRPPGYMLAVDPAAVDASRFAELVGEAHHALDINQPVIARDRIEVAMSLWRGDPMGEVGDPPYATRERDRLTEAYVDAVELRLAARLASGATDELVGEIEQLVAEHPLRERLWEALITAFYRAGRQADALDAYQRARTVLAADLGVEPGPQLRRLQRAVLDHDEDLLRPARADPVELPAPVRLAGSLFVGREHELRRLTGALDLTARRGSRTVWLIGPEGSGRFRLVAELARRVTDRGVWVSLGPTASAGPGLGIRITDTLPGGRADGCVLTVVIGQSAPSGVDVIDLTPLPEAAVAEIATWYGVDASPVVEAAAGSPTAAHSQSYRLAHAAAAARVQAIIGDETVRDPLSAAFVALVAAVRQVIAMRRRHVMAAGLEADPSPYKGLDRFGPGDADVYCGRDDVTAAVVARLAGHGLVAVVGASGVGKSSAVAAGLIPALAYGALPGSGEWPVLIGTPTRLKATEISSFEPDSTGLIVVDQFEEAYTGLSLTNRDELITALLDALRHGHRCVLTIRSDFYGRFAENAELATLAGANSLLVGPMRPDEIREAVAGPARAVGLSVDPALVDAVVAEMRGQEQALPLLSTALYAAWERRTGSRLKLEAYQKSGGVTAAVERLAEAAYQRLSNVEAEAARRILVRLADTGDDGQLVRRRVRRDQLVAAGDEDAERALATLAAGRLVTIDDGAVDVSHEALLTRWPRLAGWLAEDSAGLALRNRLIPAVRDWRVADRDPSQLWSGPRLASALDWAAEHPASLTGDESSFLEASLAAETSGERRRRRAQRRLRLLAASLAVALVVAVTAGALAIRARNVAAASAVVADAQRLGAQALVERDIRKAMREAVAGVRLSDSWETRGNLLATLQRVPRLRAAAGFDDGDRILATALRRDGGQLAVGSGTGVIRLYDTATMRVTAQVTRADHRGIYGLRFRSDGVLVAWGDRPVGPTTSSLQLWRAGLQAPLGAAVVSGALVGGTVTSDGSLIAISRADAEVVGIGTGGTVTPFGIPAHDPNDIVPSVDSQPRVADNLAVSADGRLASVGGVQPLSVTGLADGARRVLGTGFPLAFSPDGLRLVSDSGTGDLDLWDATSGSLLGVGRSQAGPIIAAAWSADGRRVVTCGDDRIVRVWSMPTGTGTPTVTDTFTGHTGRVTACEFAPDGSTVYSAGLDGAVYVWDLQRENLLGSVIRPAGPVPFRTYPAGGDSVRTVSLDSETVATLRQFDLRTGATNPGVITLLSGSDSFNDFAATADSTTIASVSAGGAVSVWSSADGRRRSGPYRPDLPGNLGGIAVGISPDGRLALVALYDRHQARDSHVYRYDASRGQADAVMDLPAWVQEIDFSLDQRFAAAALVDGRVVVWRTDTWAQVATLAAQPPGFGAGPLAFSPDGRYLAVGGQSGRPSLWKVGIWSRTWQAEVGHNGNTNSLAFSPDGQLLVSSGTDAKTFLYTVATGRHVGAAVGPDINLWTYSRFLTGTTTLASLGTDDGSIRHFDMDPAAWLHRACSLAGRDVTDEEWQAMVPDQPLRPVC
jgi:DNA-binding SARP family transcriptional activator/WD40 repeat protein